jgi:N-acetylneuraminic acid mutarotase
MRHWALALGLLAACDALFRLEPIPDPPADASVDAAGPQLEPWSSATPLPVGRDYNHTHAAFIADTLYMIGGVDVTVGVETSVVYRATWANGTLGAWSTTASLPSARAVGDIVTIGTRIYVVGGANGTTAKASVYVSDAATGNITSWVAATPMPTPLKAHAAVTDAGNLYVLGGGDVNNRRQTSVLQAQVLANGALGMWQQGPPLPEARGDLAGVAARGFLYAIGGDDDLGQVHGEVYYAAVDQSNGALGPWSTTTALPVANTAFVAVTDSNYIYVIGGDGFSPGAQVLYSRIGADGTLGPWEQNTALLHARTRHAGVLANGRLFVLGGETTAESVETTSQMPL